MKRTSAMKSAAVILIFAAFCAFTDAAAVVDATDVTSKCDSTQVAEVAFVLDGSSSIKTSNWPKVRNFVKTVVESFNVGPENVRVSVILFSHKLYEEIPLDAFDNKDDIIFEIEHLRYIKGSTFTHKALDLVRKETLAPKNCRDDTPRIAIVFTDGRSRYVGRTEDSARLLRQSGVSVVAVGVKDADEDELIAIAGNEKHVYYVDNFDHMDELTEPMTKITCEESKKECETTHKAEIAFVVDASSSVTTANWPVVLTFLSSVVGSFPMAADQIRVAVVLFSHKVQKEILLDDYSDIESIQEAIDHLPYIRGSTFTHDALETTCSDVLNTTNTRSGVSRLAIVITDGRSRYPPQTLDQALACRDEDIGLIAVGVGNAKVEELEDITGDSDKVYFVNDFDELVGLANSLKVTTCSEITKATEQQEVAA